MVWPLGFQAGLATSPSPVVSISASPPSMFIRQSCLVASPPGDEQHIVPGFRIHLGRNLDRAHVRNTAQIAAMQVRIEDLRLLHAEGGRKQNVLAVRRKLGVAFIDATGL